MSKELTVGIGDELWQAFKNVYEHKNKTKLEHDQEAEYEARDLMHEAIKAYVLEDVPKSTKEPRKHRTAKEIIDEAIEIAKSIPGMTVEALTHGGEMILWDIRLEGEEDYRGTAKDAEQLLRAVKTAKERYEALQELEAKERAEEKKSYVRLEKEIKVVRDEGREIRIDSLEQETKELFLHFIEDLTIGYVAEVAGKRAHPSVWDELHYIRQMLKESIEKGRQRR